MILNRLLQQVSAAAKAGNLGPDAPQEQIFDLQENIINQLDAITGCASKTMLYEDGWLFWCMGTYVERELRAGNRSRRPVGEYRMMQYIALAPSRQPIFLPSS